MFYNRFWVPNFWGRYIAYLRQSAAPRSGLDAAEQRSAVMRILADGKCKLIGEVLEEEPLTAGERPALEAAIEQCREQKAKLIIGKIGRLRRNIEFLQLLQGSAIKFVAADLPQANHLHMSRFIGAEIERRRQISDRVRVSLADAKSRGVVLWRYAGTRNSLQLGPAASAASRRSAALAYAQTIMRRIELIRDGRDLSLREIGRRLDELGLRAPRGGKWSAAQVRAVMLRAREAEADR